MEAAKFEMELQPSAAALQGLAHAGFIGCWPAGRGAASFSDEDDSDVLVPQHTA